MSRKKFFFPGIGNVGKSKKRRKSRTTGRKVDKLYGNTKASKSNKKKEVDPWEQMELDRQAQEYMKGLPTPDVLPRPDKYEGLYNEDPEYMDLKRKDRLDKKAKFIGPPSLDDMMSGPMAAYGAPKSIMETAAKEHPLGTAMMFEKLSKEFPKEWEDAQSQYPSAKKHQKSKEKRMMKGKKKSNMSVDEVMKYQYDSEMVSRLKDKFKKSGDKVDERMIYPTGKNFTSSENYATGGKMNYNMAGQLPGAIQGMMGTAAMANTGNFKDMPWQHQAGRVMQGASGLANLIPGVGPLVGMGMNLVGGALQTMGAPKMTDPARVNTNPMGLAMGGNMPGAVPGPQGGDFKGLSNDAMEVKADNPMQTDSVDAGQVNLDHNEVVVKDKVFSNTLKNPQTGMSFAEQEKVTQKAQGKFEKFQTQTGDTEMKDGKYHKRNTMQLFNAQENLANALGLRNQDGSPVQKAGAPEGMWSGGHSGWAKVGTSGPPFQGKVGAFVDESMRYATGGKLNYDNGGPLPGNFASQFDVQGMFSPYTAPFAQAPFGAYEAYDQDQGNLAMAPGINPDPVAGRTNFRTNQLGMPQVNSLTQYTPGSSVQTGLGNPNAFAPMHAGMTPGQVTNAGTPLQGFSAGKTMIDFTKGSIPGMTLNIGHNMPFGSKQLSSKEIEPLQSRGPIVNPNEDKGLAPPSLRDPNDPDKVLAGEDNTAPEQADSNMQQLLEAFKGSNPFGEKATKLGEAITGLGLASNRPFYVNYGDVGREEINQQNLALARAQGGEQAAINDTLAQSKAAREQAGGRSFQTMQANLSNIATRTGNQLAKTRGAFGKQEAALRTQIGARRTGIEQANFGIDRYQDDINTREYDTLWKENLKIMTNLRNMQLDRQLAFNKFRKDQELSQLLKTQDFEYGPNGELVFKQRKANIAGREGDKTNNEGSTYNNTTGGNNNFVNPGLQRFSYLQQNRMPTHGLATGATGAAIPSFASQYANNSFNFMYPYGINTLNHKGIKTK
jgi:hypothetical protein